MQDYSPAWRSTMGRVGNEAKGKEVGNVLGVRGMALSRFEAFEAL
jgi:hypothetical protein